MYTDTLSCIVKLPDEVCASHMKRVGENKKLKNFAEVLLTGINTTIRKTFVQKHLVVRKMSFTV